jgi:hypothetical protein
MSTDAQNISGGRAESMDPREDELYRSALKIVSEVQSRVDVDSDLKRRKNGTNILADAVKVDKCPPPLVGCNAAELFRATGGELGCPDLSLASEPLVIDSKARVCYAEQDILNHWMEIGPDGKQRYKKLDIDSLMVKYSKQLLEKFLDPANKKLLIAATQAARNGFNIPPIILNFFKYNPFVEAFTTNGTKHETRGQNAVKLFRGLRQFTYENNYAEYQTKEIFGTLLSNFTNSLDLDTGAEFLTIMMTPLLRSPSARGIFDIYCPSANNVDLDFLSIEAYDRSNPATTLVHAVNSNICELFFTGIAAMHRDTARIGRLQKLMNSLGEMLKFGELAPEYENPENKCRQGGVAASNAIQFLPIVLKEWLSNLPSTFRRDGPYTNAGADAGLYMNQRIDGEAPYLHGRHCGGAAGGAGGQQGGGGGSVVVQQVQAAGAQGQGAGGTNAAIANALLQQQPLVQQGGGGGSSSSSSSSQSSTLQRLQNAEAAGTTQQFGISGGADLTGGAAVVYSTAAVSTDGGQTYSRVANPVTVVKDAGGNNYQNVQDPRLILQNFISLCFYLNWVETFANGSSEDSIVSTFKSLRVSYDAAMAARANVEQLLKIKADEEAKFKDKPYKSAVTTEMRDEALAAKRGADASYLNTNVRIAIKMAKLLDIGWEKCKSDAELQAPSTDLLQNSWMDKMLPHQDIKVDQAVGGARFTVNQVPGLGSNELNPQNKDDRAPQRSYPDYPDPYLPNETWASNLIYQNISDPLSEFGINTREFRKAWKNTTVAYDGIKTKKNQVSRVGYQQLMSRIMDLHLTFAQSSFSGRKYFLKMYEYSMMQSRRSGIPDDPAASVSMFDEPGYAKNVYENFRQATSNLLSPLQDVNVCKVVVGENQYFVFKHNNVRLTQAERALFQQRVPEALSAIFAAFRSSAVRPADWYNSILTLGNSVLPGQGAPNAAQLPLMAQYIIEQGVEYSSQVPNMPNTRGTTKSFGPCEPLNTADFYMLNRRKKILDMDRPEDELFLLGIEGIAKYVDQAALFARVVDLTPNANYARQLSVANRGQANTNTPELLPVRSTSQDSLRRKGTTEGLNADERDWFARYTIFMHKISGGNPYRLAQYLLEVQNADLQVPNNFFAQTTFADKSGNPGERLADATLREAIAMRLLWLVRNPAPLFATLKGGEATETETLQGGAAEVSVAEVPTDMTVEPVDSVEADVEYLLTGGLEKRRSVVPQHTVPRHIQEAMAHGRHSLTEQERQLDFALQRIGKRPVVHYEVGEKCPVALSKYNGLFGEAGNAEWVETTHPWVKCQEKMGFQFKTRSGYCYPSNDKCYDKLDVKGVTRSTLDKARDWKELARLNNTLLEEERNRALQHARHQILSEEANENISHAELETMAYQRLPAHLRLLPENVAVQALVAVSEDVEGQIRELSDSSDEEQRRYLRNLLTSHRLLEEEWKDENTAQQVENLDMLVKDLVSNAKLCSDVSIAIKNQSSSTELRQNLRGALNYSSTVNNQNGQPASLKTEFVQSLPEDTQMSLRSPQLASKCETRDLYEKDGILVPAKINVRIPTDSTESSISNVAHDGLINWWKQYHASTLERKTKQVDKMSSIIDPTTASAETLHPKSREKVLDDSLKLALDPRARELLSGHNVRTHGSRSRSRRSRG